MYVRRILINCIRFNSLPDDFFRELKTKKNPTNKMTKHSAELASTYCLT